MNEYVGDIERHFEDIDKDFIESPILESLVQVNFAVYKVLIPKSYKYNLAIPNPSTPYRN